jgi:hypothetical protein
MQGRQYNGEDPALHGDDAEQDHCGGTSIGSAGAGKLPLVTCGLVDH